MYIWTDRQTDGQTDATPFVHNILTGDRQTERQIYRQTERQIYRQTEIDNVKETKR